MTGLPHDVWKSLHVDVHYFVKRASGIFKHAVPLVVAAIVLTTTGAHAADAKSIADVRCLIVGARLSASSDSDQRSRAALLMIYYLGRLDGRSPVLDLEKIIETEASKMTTEDFRNEMRRCGDEFALKGKRLTAIGRELAKHD